MKQPFYYFGAGVKLRYSLDRAEFCIKFSVLPTIEQLRQIVACAPEMLIAHDWADALAGRGIKDPVLYIFSDSQEDTIQDKIRAAYGTADDAITAAPHNAPVRQELFAAFDRDTDRWLLRAHSICPIQAVARSFSPYDNLSEWHRDSVSNIDALLECWKNEPKDDYQDRDDFEWLFRIIHQAAENVGMKIKYDIDDIFPLFGEDDMSQSVFTEYD
ncbi:MAG: hypothetical protein LBR06_05680 [Bacteroidales bacterium]|jgi:hypothetical protein|nr:hypothetical protein [Bacteroidales bacterium]